MNTKIYERKVRFWEDLGIERSGSYVCLQCSRREVGTRRFFYCFEGGNPPNEYSATWFCPSCLSKQSWYKDKDKNNEEIERNSPLLDI